MDKYEYKIRAEEIKSLIAKGEYAEAAEIADSIDWNRVKSVMMLCTISDLYKINRRFEDARDLLLLAYDRHPGGRSIVYSLCELSIKMDDFVPAVEYYKEFVQIAPKDSGRYVLQYKLYEAQEVSLEERIEVLEELKSKDYSEKWAYELAYLYHRIGLATKCVEECDELILWFGEGKYVLKAMELRMLHEPLTMEQQAKYDQIKGVRSAQPMPEAQEPQTQEPYMIEAEPVYREPDLSEAPTKEIPQDDLEIQVKLMNVSPYDTINMQRELAHNMKELWEGPTEESMEAAEEPAADEDITKVVPVEEVAAETEEAVTETVETAEAVQEELFPLDADEVEEEEPAEPQETKVEEVFFGETGEIDTTATQILEEMKEEMQKETPEPPKPVAAEDSDMTEWQTEETPSGFEKILGMEYDGQISMVMPESEKVEKQITGQISLQDVLIEWERMKKDSEQKRMEAVRQRVMEQTGAMFTEFEAAARDGLLEQLENEKMEAEAETEVEAEEVFEETEEEVEEEIEEALGETEEEVEEEIEEALGETEEVVEEEIEEAFGETEEVVEEEIEEALGETEEVVEEEIEEALEETEEALEEEIEGTTEEEPVADEELGETEDFTEEEAVEDEELSESDEEPEEEDFGETEELEEIEEPEEIDESAETEIAEEEATEETESETEIPAEETPVEDVPEEITEETPEAEKPEAGEPKADAKSRRRRSDYRKAPKRQPKLRPLSPEERQLFGSYMQSHSTKEQIIYAIDNISMAAYTGNVIITGEEGMDTMTLAKNLIKEVQQADSNFSGKIAKISGESLNHKGVETVLGRLVNGALIVQKAGRLTKKSLDEMQKALNQETSGMIVILEDTKAAMLKLLKNAEALKECFNIQINIEALDNDSLVEIGKKYAREKEYSIDSMGVLALHTCISDRQTSDHAVTVSEVKELVDEAIRHANRKSMGHFFDILASKRYDEEDMIILREKDFL